MKTTLMSGAVIGALLITSFKCRAAGNSLNQTNTSIARMQANDLKQTVVTATLDTSIGFGTNVLWCGTFQLVWNELCGLIGEDIHFANESTMVTELNKKAFTSKDLDSDSYIALAGFVKDGIHDKIQAALIQKFGNSAAPVLIPDKSLTQTPNDLVAYAYMLKQLEFAVPFERLDSGIDFGGRPVAAFGMTGGKAGDEKMTFQLHILDYKPRDGFVIELQTKSPRDRLILAKIAPGKTLNETIQMVDERIRAGHREGFEDEDTLAVPKFNFDITRSYNEIENIPVAVRNPKAKGASIASAKQNIRFQMDEKGVVLKSEAHFAASLGIHKHLIFNKPFLVMLKRTDAKVPYFAMWVDNPELLVQR